MKGNEPTQLVHVLEKNMLLTEPAKKGEQKRTWLNVLIK